MYTDPSVVRRKVERELEGYVVRQDHFRRRGVWILRYEFPTLLVAFVTPKIKPFPAVSYGVLFELSNYDVEPPSLRFVNPLTLEPMKRIEIQTNLARRRPNDGQLPAMVLQPGAQGFPQANPQVPLGIEDHLLQAWTPDDDRAFVCLQGVREYHDNPGHTGDSWWLHRGKGAGSILRLVDLLARYGTEAMVQPTYQINFSTIPVGFLSEPPQETSA